MAVAAYWTDDVLRDVVDALHVSLERIQPGALGATPEAASWTKVQQWLSCAEHILTTPAPQESLGLGRLPAFPLTGPELRALQAAIDARASIGRAPAAGLRHSVATAPLMTSRARVQQSLRRVHRTSLIIAAVLLLALVADVLDLTLLSATPLPVIIGVNLALMSLAVVAWVMHHARLWQHHWTLHWHHAPLGR